VYIAGGSLHLDIGQATVVELPAEETERRWRSTNPEWPIAHGVLHGITRDQFMARHKANHLSVVYAPDASTGDKALVATDDDRVLATHEHRLDDTPAAEHVALLAARDRVHHVVARRRSLRREAPPELRAERGDSRRRREATRQAACAGGPSCSCGSCGEVSLIGPLIGPYM